MFYWRESLIGKSTVGELHGFFSSFILLWLLNYKTLILRGMNKNNSPCLPFSSYTASKEYQFPLGDHEFQCSQKRDIQTEKPEKLGFFNSLLATALFKLTLPSPVTISNTPGLIEKIHSFWGGEELLCNMGHRTLHNNFCITHVSFYISHTISLLKGCNLDSNIANVGWFASYLAGYSNSFTMLGTERQE